VRTWSPATGHGYRTSSGSANPRERSLASKEATPIPESQTNKGALESKRSNQAPGVDVQLGQLAEESFAIHMRFGGEYMDENPITGAPGAFHLSSTGRKERLQMANLASLSTSFKNPAAPEMGGKKDGKGERSPKTPTGGKSRRRKSKAGVTPTSS
jgi:mediator of RNA polymerase II transcription subunit 6